MIAVFVVERNTRGTERLKSIAEMGFCIFYLKW